MSGNLNQSMAATASLVEGLLAELLRATPRAGEIIRPDRLVRAMRHGAVSGGKRVRPFLLIECALLFGAEGEGVRRGEISMRALRAEISMRALRAGAALECVHCYSLVHDDLPAMDDDDLRRGQPTVHRAFDEATAILAGDALLTIAFDILADPLTHPDGAVRADLVGRLARASGVGGMAGGQMLDLSEAAGAVSEAEILRLQAMKTGALFRFAAEAGGVIAGADAADIARLGEFGAGLGFAFQLADDLLDHAGDAAALGKRAAKDAGKGKPTLISLIGAEAARARLQDEVARAEAGLAPFGAKADTLRELCRFVAERRA